MNHEEKTSLFGIPLILLVGLGFALAGSKGSILMAEGGVHPFAIAVAIAFAIQWIAFVPAYVFQTEKYFDLIGSLSYISVAVFAFASASERSARSFVLLAMILIWAVRLGLFLFRRIHKAGKDGRFDAMKPSFIRFAAAWTLQGLWITFTAAAGIAAITSVEQTALNAISLVGCCLWLLGFGIEVLADRQKAEFKSDPKNKGSFISAGLWSKSRHPNYLGEIILWTGIALVALPALQGWQFFTLLSPVFVALLLCKVSGIPLLEDRADKTWGGQPEYESYKRQTPVLIPKLWK